MELIELGLNKQPAFPPLDRVFNPELVRAMHAQGMMEVVMHEDKITRLWTHTVLCLQKGEWNPVTMGCEGLVVREGRIIARPPGKMWWLGAVGLPETDPENFPVYDPLITHILDGERVVMFRGADGKIDFATRDRFTGAACVWARAHYAGQYGGSTWPEGVTPWFWVVGPAWRKVVEYPKNSLILGGLVENLTGVELGYEAVDYWGRVNRMPVVVRYPKGVVEALTAVTGQRGLCLSWAREGLAPLKVGISEIGYQAVRTVVETMTPRGLWTMLRDQLDIEPMLRDEKYPKEFREWVQGWKIALEAKKVGYEADALMVYSQLGSPKLQSEAYWDRSQLVQRLRERVDSKDGWMIGAVLAMADDRAFGNMVWEKVGASTIGHFGWRGGLRQ